MTASNTGFSVQLDPVNPGQFLGCCGLLELAARFWPGAEGWFGKRGRSFHVSCNGNLRTVLQEIVKASTMDVTKLDCNGLDVKPLLAPLQIRFECGKTILLDGWTKIASPKGIAEVTANPPWNFWSGQQTPIGLWKSLCFELGKQLQSLADEQLGLIFSLTLPQGGRFGFDPGPAWNALDVGFSPNEQDIEVESAPATEVLAAIGLQRFRPRILGSFDAFEYRTWHTPLAPSVAAAAMSGGVGSNFPLYRGTVVSRGQYGALGYSTLVSEGESDE